MAIIDTNYKKYNINKLPRNKYERGNSTSVVKIGGSSSATSSQSNITVDGFVGRYLWGNYFDDTQDISGPLNNVTDINMNGTLTATGPNGYVRATDAYLNHADIDTLDSQTINTYEILANSGNISDLDTDTINNSGKITTNELESQSVTAAQGNIHTLTSDNIWTKDLTVAGSAHFFELVIDQIKSAGGAFILTPADGFKLLDYEVNDVDEEITLYWLAEDNDHQIRNMWRVGDQCLIQDFNKAEVGTAYDVSNTYFWGIVNGVSNAPIWLNDQKVNYIHVSYASSKCVGDYTSIYIGCDVVMLGHRKQTGETDAQAADRQKAIYMAAYTPSSGAYDPDLLAPFVIYYEGINDFDLASHKVQWWSSGSRNANVPQNKMVGSFYLTAGKTIEQYIDENIKDADINMITLEGGSNTWFINTDANYNIVDTSQTWSTRISIFVNGNIWHVGNNASIEVYAVNGNTETILTSGYSIILYDDQGNVLQPTSSTPAHSFDITFTNMNTCIPNWYTTDNRIIRIKVGTYTPNDYSTMSWRNYDVTCVRLAKGQDGSATQVAMTEYSLVPIREDVYVDAAGKMSAFCTYNLKRIYTDAQGNTIINTNASIPSGYNVIYEDDAEIKQDSIAGKEPNQDYKQFVISIDNYFAGTSYTDYQDAWPDHAPTYINVYLSDGTNVIDRRFISVRFLAGSVFDVEDNAISLAVADSLSGSKQYTDGQITTVTNRMSSMEVDVTGIRGRVGTLETNYNDLSGAVQTKASTSELNQTANTINARVTSTTQTLQNNIDTVDDKFNNYYDKDTTEGLINVSATGVYSGVKSDINGELSETGIDITNKKITINSENTNFLGNINLYNPNEGLLLYDENGNVTVGVLNTNVTNNTNNYNIRNDSKLEAKSQGSTFTYTHSIELGTYAANDNIDVSYLSAMISQNGSRCSLNSASYSYNLKRGTTSVLTGSGNFTLDAINNAFVSGIILSYQSTALGVYTIEFTITYNTVNVLNGYLSSNITFYCSAKNVSKMQMIGNDGVNFKTGEHRQFVVGNNIVCKNGIGNELVLDDRKISKRAINYNSDTHVGLLGEISSTYPYREITGNYTATADDAIIYINGAYTVTLNTSYSGKSYFIVSNNDNAKVAASVIRYNGHNRSIDEHKIDEHKLNSFYCYHLICMAGAYYVIGQCDW